MFILALADMNPLHSFPKHGFGIMGELIFASDAPTDYSSICTMLQRILLNNKPHPILYNSDRIYMGAGFQKQSWSCCWPIPKIEPGHLI